MQNEEAITAFLHSALCILHSALIWLLLACCLIFCHGCHRGDHDDELQIFLLDRER
jgi:hypothetical protein